MERTNKVYVVGTLKEVNIRKGEKDGQDYVAGDFIIEVSADNMIEFKFFSYANSQKGPSKRYTNYLDLENMKGRRIKVSGELTGRAFYQAAQGQVIPFNEVTAGFINPARDVDEPVATFEYSGFVSKPLTERRNREEALVGYDLEVGQANYSGTNMQVVKFSVDPEARNIVKSIQENYAKHSTVSFSGIIQHTPITETKTEEVEFGDAIVKTYTSVKKSFLITGGKAPLLNELAYTAEQISTLEAAHAVYFADVEKDAKSNSDGKVSSPQPAKTSSVNSLI
jgi:hypothetical protein